MAIKKNGESERRNVAKPASEPTVAPSHVPSKPAASPTKPVVSLTSAFAASVPQVTTPPAPGLAPGLAPGPAQGPFQGPAQGKAPAIKPVVNKFAAPPPPAAEPVKAAPMKVEAIKPATVKIEAVKDEAAKAEPAKVAPVQVAAALPPIEHKPAKVEPAVVAHVAAPVPVPASPAAPAPVEAAAPIATAAPSAVAKPAPAAQAKPAPVALSENVDKTVASLKNGVTGAVAGFEKTQAEVLNKMEKAMKSAEEFVTFGQGNIEAFVKSSQIWAAGIQDISKQFAATAQSQFEASFGTFKALSGVKSIKEAVDLQTTMVRESIEKTVAETTKLTDASMKLAEQALAPLTARVTLVAEKFTPAA